MKLGRETFLTVPAVEVAFDNVHDVTVGVNVEGTRGQDGNEWVEGNCFLVALCGGDEVGGGDDVGACVEGLEGEDWETVFCAVGRRRRGRVSSVNILRG